MGTMRMIFLGARLRQKARPEVKIPLLWTQFLDLLEAERLRRWGPCQVAQAKTCRWKRGLRRKRLLNSMKYDDQKKKNRILLLVVFKDLKHDFVPSSAV